MAAVDKNMNRLNTKLTKNIQQELFKLQNLCKCLSKSVKCETGDAAQIRTLYE